MTPSTSILEQSRYKVQIYSAIMICSAVKRFDSTGSFSLVLFFELLMNAFEQGDG